MHQVLQRLLGAKSHPLLLGHQLGHQGMEGCWQAGGCQGGVHLVQPAQREHLGDELSIATL